MAIIFTGGDKGVDSVAIPTHKIGTAVIIFAYNEVNSTIPDLPAGWTSLLTGASGNNAFRIGGLIANSSSVTSGTWNNAVSTLVQTYESETGVLSFGSTPSKATGFGTLLTFPSIILDNTDNTSWLIGFAGHRANNGDLALTPSGMSNRVYHQPSLSLAAGHDTNGTVAAWASADVDIGGSDSSWHSAILELKEIASPLVIASVTDPVKTNSEITAVIEGAGSIQGAIEQNQGALITELAVNSWSDLEILAQSLDIETTSYSYGTHNLKITNDDGDTATTSFEAIPALNNAIADITSVATIGDRVEPIATGNQVRYQSLAYLDGVITDIPVTIKPNGSYFLGDEVSPAPIPNGEYTFEFRVFDHVDNTWGGVATMTVIVGNAEITPTITLSISNIPDGDYKVLVRREDTSAVIHNAVLSFLSEQASFPYDLPSGTVYTGYILDESVDPQLYGGLKGVV